MVDTEKIKTGGESPRAEKELGEVSRDAAITPETVRAAMDKMRDELEPLAAAANVDNEVLATVEQDVLDWQKEKDAEEKALTAEGKKKKKSFLHKWAVRAVAAYSFFILSATAVEIFWDKLPESVDVSFSSRKGLYGFTLETRRPEPKREQVDFVVDELINKQILTNLVSRGGEKIPYFMQDLAKTAKAEGSKEQRAGKILRQIAHFDHQRQPEYRLEFPAKIAVENYHGVDMIRSDIQTGITEKIPLPENMPEILNKIIRETFPRSWARDVGKIDIQKEAAHFQGYGENFAKSQYTAACVDAGLDDKAELTFYCTDQEFYPCIAFNEALCHELAHANDWENDNENPALVRIGALNFASQRLEDPDRFSSRYIDSIKLNDKQQEWYLKCREYWAEINRTFLDNPDDPNLPAEDRKFIEDYLKITDPDFDARAAAIKREEIIKDYFYSKHGPQLSK